MLWYRLNDPEEHVLLYLTYMNDFHTIFVALQFNESMFCCLSSSFRTTTVPLIIDFSAVSFIGQRFRNLPTCLVLVGITLSRNSKN